MACPVISFLVADSLVTGVSSRALQDGALEAARAGVETGGAGHNRRYTAPALTVDPQVAPELVALAHDPQTSGGLLAAVPAEILAAVEADLASAGVDAWRVGVVEELTAGETPGVALR